MGEHTWTVLKTVKSTDYKYEVVRCDQSGSIGLVSYYLERDPKFLPEGGKARYDEGVDVEVMQREELGDVAGLIFGVYPE